ncbi:MAG: NUDIX domain-containing protein, partial [Nitrosomonadales bacterium]|nr:NUDIX domain-containing protein [Nitrosomonadales bacterium]
GLWSLPEVKNYKNSSNWLEENLNENNFKVIWIGKHKTSFTHYKLNIHFQHILLHSSKLHKMDNYKWIKKSNLKKTALPTPINKILASLNSG